MRHRIWILCAGPAALMALLSVHCGSGVCTPGQQVSCACPGGAPAGAQVCADDGSKLGPCICEGGGGVAGSAATGGAAGSGGSGAGRSDSSSTAGGSGGAGAMGSGGAGGTGCQPDPDPCATAKANCGEVDNGCGTKVGCGMCAPGQVCPANVCCTPMTCADYPGACDGAMRPNGCGGTIFCGDAVCGDGVWMSCQNGTCACAPATDFPGADQSQANCDEFVPGKIAHYCGQSPQPEAPPDCEPTAAANGQVPGNPGVWCCAN